MPPVWRPKHCWMVRRSDQAFTLPDAAVRAAYAAAGHAEGGMVQIVQVSGMEVPNVIDLAAARARRLANRTSTELFFAAATDYPQLHAALRSRAEQLNVSPQTLDSESGLADGYLSKVLGPAPFKGVITKTALEPVLKALRLRLIVVDDQETAAARGELPQRDVSQVRLNNECRRNKGRRCLKRAAPSKRRHKVDKPKRGKPYLSG
jgi:hypothetical protein